MNIFIFVCENFEFILLIWILVVNVELVRGIVSGLEVVV